MKEVNVNKMNWTPNQYTRVPRHVYKNSNTSSAKSLVFRAKIKNLFSWWWAGLFFYFKKSLLAVKPQPYFFIAMEAVWSAKLAQFFSHVVTFWLPAIWLARAYFATNTWLKDATNIRINFSRHLEDGNAVGCEAVGAWTDGKAPTPSWWRY